MKVKKVTIKKIAVLAVLALAMPFGLGVLSQHAHMSFWDGFAAGFTVYGFILIVCGLMLLLDRVFKDI